MPSASKTSSDRKADEPPLSRADRKVIIQQGIVDAAFTLTERHGPDGWTMQMLASELGWSTGAAYRHLAGKDALLDQVAIEVLRRVEIPEAGEGEWDERLKAMARSTWHQLSKQRWVASYILSHQEAATFANRFFGAPLVQILAEAGYDLDTVSLPIGLYAAFIFGSVCGFEADTAVRAAAEGKAKHRRRPHRRMKSYRANEHFEWGLTALIEAIRAQGARPIRAQGPRR